MSLNRVRCFFDVEVDGVPLGRIIFELFNDICPKTAENFRALCTGELGQGETTAKPLHYRNVKFHRVIKDFMIQCGDFSSGNGTGGESIYGGQFEDENFDIKHDTPFLLSMANRGKDTNGSQFFITTQTASHLDGKHVVFGRVLSGQEVVVSIENLPVDNRSRPLQQALIANCGELIMQTSGQVKAKEKKKKKKKIEETAETTLDEKKKKKKKKEKKHKQKKEKDGSESEEQTEEPVVETKAVDNTTINYKPHPLATISVINPEEIPEVPKNRFLDRGFQNRRPEAKEEEEQSGRLKSKANVRFYTRSGRKVKGRGLLRYRTPSRSRSRSRSATPPHWRQAQRRTVTYERYQRHTEELESREKEIEERRKRREERHRMLGMDKDDQDEGEWSSRGKKLGSVIRGRMMSDSIPEDKTLKDWRIARHETLHEDKENVKDVMDLRQKLKGKSSSQSFAKGSFENKRSGKDEAPLDLDDLDYEAPSELEDDENTDGQKENGTKDRHSEERSMRDGKENRERKSSERDRERERRDGQRRVDNRFRSRNVGDRDRDRRYRDRERDRRDRDRRERRSRSRDRRSRSRDRRRDSRSRERRRRDTSRDRNRSTRKHRDRSRRRSSSESEGSKK